MGAMVFEIKMGGRHDSPLVKGVGTKRLGKGRIKAGLRKFQGKHGTHGTTFSDQILELLTFSHFKIGNIKFNRHTLWNKR